MITTTLNRIRECGPCGSGWKKLLKHLGKTEADDEPLPFSVIVESNGIEDAVWCCEAEPQYEREWRLFAVWCARQVQHLMTDERSIECLDVAEAYANGNATAVELDAAVAAAVAAARSAAGDSAWSAAWEAAEAAARSAAWAAWAAVGAAAWAAWAAAGDAARSAAWDAARAAAGDAARSAAWDAARAAQRVEFLRIVTETEAREK